MEISNIRLRHSDNRLVNGKLLLSHHIASRVCLIPCSSRETSHMNSNVPRARLIV